MPSVTEPPKIHFDSNQDMVVISGTLFVGSSDCNIATLTSRNYDHDSDTFTVTVGSGTRDSGNSCSGDESADAYRIRAEFESALPETVTATEEDGDNRSTTAHR